MRRAADARHTSPFHDAFVRLFNGHFDRVYRYLHRLSGEPDLASDLAQEAFVRLYRRGAEPDAPEAWLITVATNLFRNAQSTTARRLRLMTAARGTELMSSPPASPSQAVDAADTTDRVRRAIDGLPDRDRALLLMLADGRSYRDMASALDLRESSVGTLLARAKRAFRQLYEEGG